MKYKDMNKSTILPEIKPYNWDVEIKGVPYYVAKLEEFPHAFGSENRVYDVWAYPRNEEPTVDNLVPFLGEGCRWGYEIKSVNYLRHKDGTTVYHHHVVTIKRNDKDFYSFSCTNLGSASAKARVIIDKCKTHPMFLDEIDFDKKVIGRKVYWRNAPGIITRYIQEQACVIIEPDGKPVFEHPAYYEDVFVWNADENIKVEIFNENIWWFRRNDD